MRDQVCRQGLGELFVADVEDCMDAAELRGLDQLNVSALVRGRVEGHSTDRLFRLLNALGQRVEITVQPKATGARSRAVVVT